MVISNGFVINQSNNNFLLNHFVKENLSSLIVDKSSNFIEISKNYLFTLRFNTISIKFYQFKL